MDITFTRNLITGVIGVIFIVADRASDHPRVICITVNKKSGISDVIVIFIFLYTFVIFAARTL